MEKTAPLFPLASPFCAGGRECDGFATICIRRRNVWERREKLHEEGRGKRKPRQGKIPLAQLVERGCLPCLGRPRALPLYQAMWETEWLPSTVKV